MLSFEDYRALLGKQGERYSDKHVAELRDLTWKFADVVFRLWREERQRTHKNTTPLWIRNSKEESVES